MPVTTPVMTVADGEVRVTSPVGGCAECEAQMTGWTISTPHTGCTEHGFVFAHREPGLSVLLAAPDLWTDDVMRDLWQALTRHGATPQRARSVWRHPRLWGVRDPGDARQVLTALAFAVDPKWSWFTARPWIKAGLTERVAKWWVHDPQFGARHAGRWVAAGVKDPDQAREWLRAGKGPEDAAEWVPTGLHSTTALEWVKQGVLPERAVLFDSVEHYNFSWSVGAPGDPQWGALMDLASDDFVRQGRAAGRSVEEVRALAQALVPEGELRQRQAQSGFRRSVEGAWPWSLNREMTLTASVCDDVDWLDLSTCLRAGMTIGEGLEFLRSGKDMGPVRLLVGLSA